MYVFVNLCVSGRSDDINNTVDVSKKQINNIYYFQLYAGSLKESRLPIYLSILQSWYKIEKKMWIEVSIKFW